ncbi:MFS transporter, partial [Bacteroides uniformis]
FRVLKKVGIRECKVFREKYYPQGWRFFPKTGGLTLLSRQIPELPLRPERK